MDFVIRLVLIALITLSVSANSSLLNKKSSDNNILASIIPGIEGIGGTGDSKYKKGICNDLSACQLLKIKKDKEIIQQCITECKVKIGKQNYGDL